MSRFDNPIFVIYINTGGKSRQRAEETIQSVIDRVSPILGESNIFIPIENGDNRIELLWPGANNINNKSITIENLIKVLNDAFSIIQGKWEDEKSIKEGISQIKSSLRTLKIDQLDGIS